MIQFYGKPIFFNLVVLTLLAFFNDRILKNGHCFSSNYFGGQKLAFVRKNGPILPSPLYSHLLGTYVLKNAPISHGIQSILTKNARDGRAPKLTSRAIFGTEV